MSRSHDVEKKKKEKEEREKRGKAVSDPRHCCLAFYYY